MTLQKITTPKGETLVVLSVEEYEKLVDEADVAAVLKIKRDIEAGRDEMVPAEFANRILDGESPITVFRELRGLSGKELAAKASISGGYLSEIESGKKEGKVLTLTSIASALKVDLNDLV